MTNQPTDRRAILWLGIAYLVSLCLPALYSRGGPGMAGSGSATLWGIMCLGFLPLVMVIPFWWANPLFYAGLICLAFRRYLAALILGILATLLALGTILMCLDDLRPRPGQDPFFPFGPGFFVWVGSMVGLVVVSCRRIRQNRPARLNKASPDLS